MVHVKISHHSNKLHKARALTLYNKISLKSNHTALYSYLVQWYNHTDWYNRYVQMYSITALVKMAMIGTLAFGAVKWWVRTSISIRLTSHSICWVRQSSQPITWLVQKPTLCGKNVRLNWTNTGQWNTGDVLSLGKVGWLVLQHFQQKKTISCPAEIQVC